MKRTALVVAVLMVIPLAALWAQSDPYAPAAGDPASTPARDAAAADPAPADPQAAPADPQPASADPAPARDAAAADPAADPSPAGDPDADANALPATASHGPLILLMGLLAIGMFLVLKVFRGRSVDVS